MANYKYVGNRDGNDSTSVVLVPAVHGDEPLRVEKGSVFFSSKEIVDRLSSQFVIEREDEPKSESDKKPADPFDQDESDHKSQH